MGNQRGWFVVVRVGVGFRLGGVCGERGFDVLGKG